MVNKRSDECVGSNTKASSTRLGQCSGMTPEPGRLDVGSGASDAGAMTAYVHSATFPNANGKTVTVEVYGRRASQLLTARICTAFRTFSLSYLQR